MVRARRLRALADPRPLRCRPPRRRRTDTRRPDRQLRGGGLAVASAAAGNAVIEDQLPPSLLSALAEHGNTRAFRAHTILLNEGDSGGSLYIVLEGRVRAYASSPEGRDVV